MWKERHLKAVGKGKYDMDGQPVIDLMSDTLGMVEELEKAHIYIAQLDERTKRLEEKIHKLKSRRANTLSTDR